MELWKDPVFLALVDSLQECVLALDHDGRIAWVQCPAESWLNQSPESLVGMSLEQVFPDNVAAAYGVASPAMTISMVISGSMGLVKTMLVTGSASSLTASTPRSINGAVKGVSVPPLTL